MEMLVARARRSGPPPSGSRPRSPGKNVRPTPARRGCVPGCPRGPRRASSSSDGTRPRAGLAGGRRTRTPRSQPRAARRPRPVPISSRLAGVVTASTGSPRARPVLQERQRHVQELLVRAVDAGLVREGPRGAAHRPPSAWMAWPAPASGRGANRAGCPSRARPAWNPSRRSAVPSPVAAVARAAPHALRPPWPSRSAPVTQTMARSPARSQYSTPARLTVDLARARSRPAPARRPGPGRWTRRSHRRGRQRAGPDGLSATPRRRIRRSHRHATSPLGTCQRLRTFRLGRGAKPHVPPDAGNLRPLDICNR